MQFIALNRRLVESFSAADYRPLLQSETERAAELYGKGVIRQLWSRGDVEGVCVLLEADDEETARQIMDSMPIATHHMSEVVELVALSPYFGFVK